MALETSHVSEPFTPTEDESTSPTLARLGAVPGYLLRRAATLSHASLADSLAVRGLDLTPVQCGMLMLIDDNPGLSQNDMARLMMVEGATVVQALTRLREQGLVQRYRIPSDRRVFALHLTVTGKRMLDAVTQAIEAHHAAFLGCLSAEERDVLAQSLRKIINHGGRSGRDSL